jgi:hypothetical protein
MAGSALDTPVYNRRLIIIVPAQNQNVSCNSRTVGESAVTKESEALVYRMLASYDMS